MAALILSGFPAALSPAADDTASQAGEVRRVMEASTRLEEVPFREVVAAASGKKVLPFDPASPEDQAVLAHVTRAADELLLLINRPDSPLRGLRRINEGSRLVENELHRLLTGGDFECSIPLSGLGKPQRSGYPDLQLTHVPSGRVTYLDPKLFEKSARSSTLRTFYYEPAALTGKVHHDARHLLLGLSHDGKDGAWTFTGWDLLDLHGFTVRLKAEFQGSNKDLYQEKLLLRRSRGHELSGKEKQSGEHRPEQKEGGETRAPSEKDTR